MKTLAVKALILAVAIAISYFPFVLIALCLPIH